METTNQNTIQWTKKVHIFKSLTILKHLGIAIGIPFGFVIVFLLISSGGSRDTLYGVGLIILTLLLTYIFIRIVYGGMYQAEFAVDEKGIQCISQQGQERKNKIVNMLTVLAGFLSQKPAVAGAGILAEAKSHVFIPWENIRKVKYVDKEYVVIISGGLAENIALFCTRENYPLVKNAIRSKL